jgi:hypothetical protein
MFLVHLVFALFVAILLSAVFAVAFRRRGPWESLFLLFLVLFLLSWAGGAWLAPIGPTLWGEYWLPFVLVGIIMALFLAALVPPPRESTVELVEEGKDAAERKVVLTGLGIFFWMLVTALVIAIVVRYV